MQLSFAPWVYASARSERVNSGPCVVVVRKTNLMVWVPDAAFFRSLHIWICEQARSERVNSEPCVVVEGKTRLMVVSEATFFRSLQRCIVPRLSTRTTWRSRFSSSSLLTSTPPSSTLPSSRESKYHVASPLVRKALVKQMQRIGATRNMLHPFGHHIAHCYITSPTLLNML